MIARWLVGEDTDQKHGVVLMVNENAGQKHCVVILAGVDNDRIRGVEL